VSPTDFAEMKFAARIFQLTASRLSASVEISWENVKSFSHPMDPEHFTLFILERQIENLHCKPNISFQKISMAVFFEKYTTLLENQN
jgi:hypothetical protein